MSKWGYMVAKDEILGTERNLVTRVSLSVNRVTLSVKNGVEGKIFISFLCDLKNFHQAQFGVIRCRRFGGQALAM